MIWTWTPYRDNYKGHRIEACGQYFNVYPLSNIRQAVWGDLTEQDCKKWIDSHVQPSLI